MIFHEKITQGSEQWHELRRLKFTASNATPVGANGAGLKTLVTNLVADAICPPDPELRYVSEAMARGNELEPIARTAYEFKTGQDVTQVGFIERDQYVGFSPDGLVGEDGLIEIKCRDAAKHLEFMFAGKIDSGTLNQCQFQLFVSKRKWVDLVYYNPDFKNSLLIERITPAQNYFDTLRAGLDAGVKMLNEILSDGKVADELKRQSNGQE
jgi:hypothetical protein